MGGVAAHAPLRCSCELLLYLGADHFGDLASPAFHGLAGNMVQGMCSCSAGWYMNKGCSNHMCRHPEGPSARLRRYEHTAAQARSQMAAAARISAPYLGVLAE
eukprot:11849632-Alexandrium_andersonii.AAC.1